MATRKSSTDRKRLKVDPEVVALIMPYYRKMVEHQKEVAEIESIIGSILAANFEGFRTKDYGFDFESNEFYPIDSGEGADE